MLPIIFPLLVILLTLVTTDAQGQNRMPPLSPDKMTEAQKKAVADLFQNPSGTISGGPYAALLRSPEVLRAHKAAGDYLLNYRGALSPRLTEIAILLTARHWTQQFIWNAHVALAAKAGVSSELVAAIADGRRGAGMAEDDASVHDFCDELLRNKSVSDSTYGSAVSRLGEQAVIEMIAAVGHWSLNAMVMNAVRTPLPPDAASRLPPFPR